MRWLIAKFLWPAPRTLASNHRYLVEPAFSRELNCLRIVASRQEDLMTRFSQPSSHWEEQKGMRGV